MVVLLVGLVAPVLAPAAWPQGEPSQEQPAQDVPPQDASTAPDERWRFRSIGVGDGLAQSTVLSLHQDRFGFVWIGTQNGAQRYDGLRFVDIAADPPAAGGLRHRRAQSLFEDRAGHLWIGTLGGLDRIDTGELTWLALGDLLAETTSGHRIDAIAEDAGGRLWLAGDGFGVAVLFPARESVTRLGRRDGSLPSDRVQALAVDEIAGGVWLGFADAPPIFLSPSADHSRFEGRPVEGLPEADTRAIAVGAEHVWLATAGGLARVERATRRAELERHDPARPESLASDDLEAVMIDRQGRLWTGGARGLDLRLAENRFRHFRQRLGDEQSLSHDHVRSLLEDDGGLIWVGTELGGVTIIDPRPRMREASGELPSKIVRAFAEDAAGRLWVGTDGGGVCRESDATSGAGCLPVPELADAKRVFALLPEPAPASASKSVLWVGAQSGLYRLSTGEAADGGAAVQTFRHDPDRRESLGPGGVRALDLDETGRLWVALWGGGLSRLDPGAQRFEHFRAQTERPFALPSDLVMALFRDRRGHLWVGTAEGLARRTADGRFHSYHHDPLDPTSLLGDVVRAVHQDRAGHLWVGTDAGLDRLPAELVRSPPVAAPNNRGFTHFTESDGLLGGTVNAIEEDEAGRLWLATLRGLVRFDPVTATFTHFDRYDGLVSLEMLAGASLATADGRLFFGSLGGYNVFDPLALETNTYEPPVRITAVRDLGDGRALGTSGELTLPAHAVVEVELAALDFSQPSSNRYAYRLEGRDEQWRELGTRASFTLSALDADEYRLDVRGSNGDGVWNENRGALTIRLQPSPWRSGWAVLLYALTLGGLLGLLILGRRRSSAWGRHVDDVNRLNENRLRLALDGSGDGLWDWNLESGEVFRSGIAEMLGFDPSELPRDASWRQRWIHPDDHDRVEAAIQAHLRGETRRFEAEYRARDGGGSWRWILDRGNVVERDEDGEPLRMAGTFKDLTRHKETERELRLWSTVFEAIDEGVMVLGRDGRVQAVNDAFCLLFGRPRHSLLGRPAERLRSPSHDDAFYRRMRRELLVRGSWQGELRHPRPDGTERLVWIEMRAVEEPSVLAAPKTAQPVAEPAKRRRPRPSHYVLVISDITRRKRAEEELRYLADYDPLTGLPNRSMFAREAATALEKAQEEERRIALIFADLDNFKQINDTLGHAVGDQMLQEAARRLLTSVRTDDLVARLGGDELIVLLHDPSGRGTIDRDSVTQVARRILGAFTPSFKLEHHNLSVGASLGIALAPDDGEDVDELIEHADSAMYEAKSEGRNRFCFYRRELTERALERMTVDDRLRRALESGALELHYQPIFDLARSEAVAVEALLRWPQSDGEIWRPERFLDIAETTGLIVPLGTWVLEKACRQGAAWHQAGRRLGLTVNLASQQLDQEDLTEIVEAALLSSGLPASQLCLEIKEDAVVERTEGRMVQAEKLRRLGVRLSIDDFGTGFSSLPHLQRLPFDELKIDRSFIGDLGAGGATLVRTMVAMAEGMEVEVVAEGVESEEQLETLAELGCHRAQGHLIGHPLPPDELDAMMSSTEAPWRRLAVSRRRRARRAGKENQGALRQAD